MRYKKINGKRALSSIKWLFIRMILTLVKNQKYILFKLKDKYNEEFIITEVKKYKEEKIGLN